MNELILNDQDLSKEEHWPVEVIFGFYEGEGREDMSFLNIVKGFGAGIGYDYNDKSCTFWQELDEYDMEHTAKFDVLCQVVRDKCSLTHQEFFGYMGLACKKFIDRFPGSSPELRSALSDYEKRFLA